MKWPSRKKRIPVNHSRQVSSTGRTAPYAYYAQRSPERATLGRQVFRDTVAARSAKRAATYWLRRFGLLMILLAVVISLVNVLGLSTDPKIISIPTNSGQTTYLHSLDTYQAAAAQLFAGSVLNRTKITLDASGIAAALQRQFPELAAVSVSFPLIGHRPLVYIEPTQPVLVLLTNSGSAYIVDEKGRAVSAVGVSAVESLHLVGVQDKSGATITVGQSALAGDTITFIQEIIFQMQAKHLAISTLVLPAATNELDMYLAGQTYEVKFNLVNPTADQQIGTFLAVRHDLQGKGVVPRQYIDVRIDGRAYYR